MSEEKVYLTVQQAISCLDEGDSIHTFVNPAGILMGADWSRRSIIETLHAHPDNIEIGGKACRAMGHGLVVMRGDDPLFIQADETKLSAFDKSNKVVSGKAFINNQECKIDEILEGFTIHQKPSSNVQYFGDNGIDVFVQFKSGSYIYQGVVKEHIQQMHQAESIGKFVSQLGKIYNYVTTQYPLVVPVQQPAVQ